MDLQVLMSILFIILNLFNGFVDAQEDELINDNDDDKNNDNKNDVSYEYYIDNEIDMKPTYRSGFEKFLQGLSITLRTSRPTGIAGKFISGLPQPVRAFFLGSQKQTQMNDAGDNGRGFGEFLNTIGEDFKAIFPGTLWCGDGNAAQNPNDFGEFSDTDKCCKEHDHCPFTISAGESRDLLRNNGIFTRSACSCDHQFYNCLKKVNSLISESIGMTYFNILRPQCFGYYYPIEYCEKYESIRTTEKKCLQYKFDTTKNQTLEWYDYPDF